MAAAPLRNNSSRTPYSRLPVASESKLGGRPGGFAPRKFSLNTSMPPTLESVPEASSSGESQIPTRTNSTASVDHTVSVETVINRGDKPSSLQSFRQKFGLKTPVKAASSPKTSKIPQSAVKSSKSAPNQIDFAPMADLDSFVVDQSPAVELPPTPFGGNANLSTIRPAKLSLSPLAAAKPTIEPVKNIDKRPTKPLNLPLSIPKNKSAESLSKSPANLLLSTNSPKITPILHKFTTSKIDKLSTPTSMQMRSKSEDFHKTPMGTENLHTKPTIDSGNLAKLKVDEDRLKLSTIDNNNQPPSIDRYKFESEPFKMPHRLTREAEIDLTPVQTYSSTRRVSSRRFEYQQKLIRSGSKSIDSPSPSDSTVQSRSSSISSLTSDGQNRLPSAPLRSSPVDTNSDKIQIGAKTPTVPHVVKSQLDVQTSGKNQFDLNTSNIQTGAKNQLDQKPADIQTGAKTVLAVKTTEEVQIGAEYSSPSDMSGMSTSDQSAVSPSDFEKIPKGRGLIDDDYADQPGLVSSNQSTLGSVTRRLPKNSIMSDSMTSSVSVDIDDDDCMLDFNMAESIDLGAAGLDESIGPIRMRRGADTNSLKKRQSLKSKRSSLASVQDELDTLIGANNSVQMVSDSRSNSITSDTAGKPVQNGRPLLRPPASLRAYQTSIDGQVGSLADSTLTLSMAQDVTVVKTLLLRLRRILQEADTINPFESSLNVKNGMVKFSETNGVADEYIKEIGELKRQNATLKRVIDDKDRTIVDLRRELAEAKATGIHKSDQISTTV